MEQEAKTLRQAGPWSIPNLLTYARILVVPLVVLCFDLEERGKSTDAARWWALGLFVFASVTDFLDGYFARRTNHVTRLGELLDMNIDSIGVFAATFLAVQYGVVPWWYLPIGLARYLFLAGIWLRVKSGKPVHELPFSVRRRGFAALKMGFMFVVLFPVFSPPATFVAAAAFGIPFAVGFLWDWLIVSGALSPEAGSRFTRVKVIFLQQIPVALRLAAVLLSVSLIEIFLRSPDSRVLAFLAGLSVLMTLMGVAGRISAILALVLLGTSQTLGPLDLMRTVLIPIYIALLFLGSGVLSLWPVEDRLIYHQLGKP